MGDLSKNFSRHEFLCRCGCGFGEVRPELVQKLQAVRDRVGKIRINSACRCAEHNRQFGGKSTSSHLKGRAVDIACLESRNRFLLLEACLGEGFHRIGIGSLFIHVDLDSDKPGQLIWVYKFYEK
ncbi:hypothetical protein UR09_05080 [Candidatus Nitromaritima sp. SCGC AAA799-A02]|nr:hypothetical protein UR09_05080 [Candidatus Nitromaritima sp. SCGC AAA799-A02]